MEVKWCYPGLLAAVVVFTATSLLVFRHMNMLQPTPFIDEAFHIPQCQQYCAGNYTHWDNKITTLPGLYLLSVGVLGYLSGLEPPTCTVYLLRLTNVLFSIVTLIVIYSILKVLNPTEGSGEWRPLVGALSLASFPVLYQFAFLYYTDVASTMLVLLMYALHLHRQPCTAAAIGALSIAVRQNNVVWVALMAGLTSADFMVATLTHSRAAARKKTVDPCSPRIVREVLHYYSTHMKRDPLSFAELLTDIVYEGIQYMLVCAGFCAFVAWNGGVVVGDRAAHEATLNAPQIVYGLAVAALFLAPLMADSWQEMLATVQASPLLWGTQATVLTVLLQSAPPPHPYLLADNRHLAFYAWRRWLGHPQLRLTAIPAALATLLLLTSRAGHRPFLLRAGLLAASALVVVPQRLLEFRYFILPFLFVRLHLRTPRPAALLAESVLYAVVNAAVLYLFTVKTFTWEDQPGVQRIIW